MIAEMGEKVAISFLKNNVITKEEVDVYQYGAELVISQTFATVTTVWISSKRKLLNNNMK